MQMTARKLNSMDEAERAALLSQNQELQQVATSLGVVVPATDQVGGLPLLGCQLLGWQWLPASHE